MGRLWGGMHLQVGTLKKIIEPCIVRLAISVVVLWTTIHELDLILGFLANPKACIQGRKNKYIRYWDRRYLRRDNRKVSVNLHIDYLQKPFQRGIKIWVLKDVWDMALGEVKQTITLVRQFLSTDTRSLGAQPNVRWSATPLCRIIVKARGLYESFISSQKAPELAEQMKYSSIENSQIYIASSNG